MSQIAQSILSENPDINIYDAFISYGRRESKSFATKLYQQLNSEGFKVWFDQNDIPLGVDFQNQIDEGINRAQNFIFIISPHSLKSPYCMKEVVLALKRGKRIIPILHVEPEEKEVWDKMHPALSKINWLYMREKYKPGVSLDQLSVIDPFEKGFGQLLELIRRHSDYVWQHTYFLIRALDWERGNQQTDLLLVGKDRIHAESWLKVRFKKEQPPCEPTPFHCDYICESTKNSNNLMTEVFISYATENEAEMQQVAATLKRNSITIWTNRTDIQTGSAFQAEINKGIEEADNFLFMISPQSIESKYCQMELEHALKHNKRIISILVHPTNLELLPEKLQQLQFIDYTTSWGQGADVKQNYLEDTRKLFRELKEDAHYYRQHKMLLSKALKWERQNHNTSILLRGYDLQNAEAWFKLSKTHKEHPALPIHEAFIQASIDQPKDLSVEAFISYSRADADFARKLNDSLQLQGKTTWFDQESIASGADFQQEINNGIENSDNFVFIISPNSINSPYCADEVEYALSFNKRIITILYDPVDPKALHPGLAAVQWIDFNLNDGDFSANFSELIRTLDNDREHVHAHTKWAIRAAAWEDKDKDKSLLLRGSEFALAEEWLANAQEANKSPRPTAIQKEYIADSKAAIIAEEQKEQRTIRRLRILLFVAFLALCGAGYATWSAYNAKVRIADLLKKSRKMKDDAFKQKEHAEKLKDIAESQRDQLAAKEDSLKHAVELAVINERKASDASIRANNSKKRALAALEEARIAKKEAIEEARLSKNAATVLSKANIDPTVTLRMFEYLNRSRKKGGDGVTTNSKRDSKLLDLIDTLVNKNNNNFFYESRVLHSNWLKESTFSGKGGMVTCDFDKIYLRDKEGVLIKQFPSLHKDYIFDVDISYDGDYILSAGYDNKAILWNNKGESVLTVPDQNTDLDTKKFTAAAISPRNDKFAVGDQYGNVVVYDFSGKQLAKVELENVDLSNQKELYILDMVFSPDGKMLAYVGEGKVASLLVFNDSTNTISRSGNIKLEGHQGDVVAVDFSPNGDKLLTAGWGKVLFMWDTKGNSIGKIETEAPISKAIFLNNDQQIALTTYDEISKNSKIQFWNGEGKLLKSLPAHIGRMRSLSFDVETQKIVSGGHDQYMRMWDLRQLGFPSKTFADKRNSIIRSMVISPKDSLIITTGDDSTARIVHFDGHVKRVLKHDSKYVMVAKMTNRGILTATYEGKISLWSKKGVLQKEMTPSLEGGIWDVDVSKDEMTLLVSSSEGEIRMFDWSGTERTGFDELKLIQSVVSVAYSPTSRFVLAGGFDKQLLCWDIMRNKEYFSMNLDHSIKEVAFSPDGKLAVAAVGDKVVIIDMATQNTKTLKRNKTVSSFAFTADSKKLIVGDQNLKHSYWDLSTYTLLKEIDGQSNYTVAIQQNPVNHDIYFVDEYGGIMVMKKELAEYDSKKEALQFTLLEMLEEGLDVSFEDVLNTLTTVDDYLLAAETYWKLSGKDSEYSVGVRADFAERSIFCLEKIKQENPQLVKERGELPLKYTYAVWYRMLNEEFEKAMEEAQKGIECDVDGEYLELHGYRTVAKLYHGNLQEAIDDCHQWEGKYVSDDYLFLDFVMYCINDYFLSKGITSPDIATFKLALLKPAQLLQQGTISFGEMYSNNDVLQLQEAAEFYHHQLDSIDKYDYSEKIKVVTYRIKLLEKIHRLEGEKSSPEIAAKLAPSLDRLAWFQLNELKQNECKQTLLRLKENYPTYRGDIELTEFFYKVLYGDFEEVKTAYYNKIKTSYSRQVLMDELAVLENLGSRKQNLKSMKLLLLSVTELLEQGLVDYEYCIGLSKVEELYEAAAYYEVTAREADYYDEAETRQRKANELYLRGYTMNRDYADIKVKLSAGLGWEAWYQIYNEKYDQAIANCDKALGYDESTEWLFTQKAVAQILHGDYDAVMEELAKWKDKPFVTGESFEEQFLRYLDVFIDYGLYHEDIPRVKRSLLSFIDLLEQGYITLDEIPEDISGEELLDVAFLYKERGDNEEGVYDKAYRYKQAKKLFEMASEKDANDDEARAYTLWNYSYYGLFDFEYSEAREAAEQCIKAFERLNGSLTSDQVGIYKNLALGLLLEGSFEEAKDVYEEWMGKMYGDRLFATLFWEDIDALALEGHELYNVDEIKLLLAPVLLSKGDKRDFYTYGYYFGDFLYLTDNPEEILPLLDYALKFYLPYDQIYPSDEVKLEIGNCYWNYSWYLIELGKPKQALENANKGIAIFDKIYGASLQDGNGIITCLAPALLLTGKEQEAMDVYKKWKDEAYGYDGETLGDIFLEDLRLLKTTYPKYLAAWKKVEVELKR